MEGFFAIFLHTTVVTTTELRQDELIEEEAWWVLCCQSSDRVLGWNQFSKAHCQNMPKQEMQSFMNYHHDPLCKVDFLLREDSKNQGQLQMDVISHFYICILTSRPKIEA